MKKKIFIIVGEESGDLLCSKVFSKINLELNNLNPYKLTFNNYLNFEDRDNEEIYENFLNAFIPSINDIIKSKYKEIDSLNLYKFINELEAFDIYQDDVSTLDIETLLNKSKSLVSS